MSARLHCVYCGKTKWVDALYERDAEGQTVRTEALVLFWDAHETLCGPKAVGAMLGVEEEGDDAAL